MALRLNGTLECLITSSRTSRPASHWRTGFTAPRPNDYPLRAQLLHTTFIISHIHRPIQPPPAIRASTSPPSSSTQLPPTGQTLEPPCGNNSTLFTRKKYHLSRVCRPQPVAVTLWRESSRPLLHVPRAVALTPCAIGIPFKI